MDIVTAKQEQFVSPVTSLAEVKTVTGGASGGRPVLLVGVSNTICALPLAHVIETMRALPLQTIAGTPPYVCGLSIVRGIPTPVVDLGMVLGKIDAANQKFVTLRLGQNQVVVAVSTVIGVQYLDQSKIESLPPLLRNATNQTIESIGTLDRQMLLVLHESWTLPDNVWQSLSEAEKS
jgi:purine-binding chemotaxis protein CheW